MAKYTRTVQLTSDFFPEFSPLRDLSRRKNTTTGHYEIVKGSGWVVALIVKTKESGSLPYVVYTVASRGLERGLDYQTLKGATADFLHNLSGRTTQQLYDAGIDPTPETLS